MLESLRKRQATMVPTTSTVISASAHLFAIALLFGVIHASRQIVPYKLPGTSLGAHALTYYAPGSAHPTAGALAVEDPIQAITKPALESKQAAPAPDQAQSATSERGVGTTAQSGLGDGDIKIALGKYFPPPKPDLSSLPHGTKGDVILDAVIDEQGAITDLKLVQGLGPAIDDAVIATVKGWSYTPAMKNGQPVASEQEFLFHYERS